jgi:MoaA/NifB/PqqE/SkfB family radical SAM enzyme
MINAIKIVTKKIRNIPSGKRFERIKLGIKKYLLGYPSYIILQTVSACNLQCKHCFINDYYTHITDGIIKIMSFEEFLLFVNRLKFMIKKASYFQFSTFEAILNKHLFMMMNEILKINPQMQFPFLSNAMQLTEEKIKQLEKYPVSEVNISLDGCTKETVEKFKTGVVFEKIIDTIQLLKQSALKDKVVVTFVAHKNNIAELPDYIDFVHHLGVKQIYVTNLLTFTKDLESQVLYTPQGNKYAQTLFDEAVKRVIKNKQNISIPRLQPVQMGCQTCESFFVNINGDVSPCDFLAVSTPFTLWGQTVQNPPVIFGNIFKDDPLEIYRSMTAKKFRAAHRSGKNLPSSCTHCIDAYGLLCSNRTHYEA